MALIAPYRFHFHGRRELRGSWQVSHEDCYLSVWIGLDMTDRAYSGDPVYGYEQDHPSFHSANGLVIIKVEDGGRVYWRRVAVSTPNVWYALSSKTAIEPVSAGGREYAWIIFERIIDPATGNHLALYLYDQEMTWPDGGGFRRLQ